MPAWRDSVVEAGARLDRRLMFRLSAAGLAAELAIAVTTVLPNAPVVPPGVELPLFLGCFVVQFRSVTVLISRTEGRPRLGALRELMGPVPVIARIIFVAFFIGTCLITAPSFGHIAGQPTEIHGRYFLNDHGSLIPVTHRAYLHAQVLHQRLFTLIPSVFYALGVLANWPPRSAARVSPTSSGTAPLSV